MTPTPNTGTPDAPTRDMANDVNEAAKLLRAAHEATKRCRPFYATGLLLFADILDDHASALRAAAPSRASGEPEGGVCTASESGKHEGRNYCEWCSEPMPGSYAATREGVPAAAPPSEGRATQGLLASVEQIDQVLNRIANNVGCASPGCVTDGDGSGDGCVCARGPHTARELAALYRLIRSVRHPSLTAALAARREGQV